MDQMGSFPHSRVSQSAFSRILVLWGVKWDVTRCYEEWNRARHRRERQIGIYLHTDIIYILIIYLCTLYSIYTIYSHILMSIYILIIYYI